MSTENVNVARFARNVEWDFFSFIFKHRESGKEDKKTSHFLTIRSSKKLSEKQGAGIIFDKGNYRISPQFWNLFFHSNNWASYHELMNGTTSTSLNFCLLVSCSLKTICLHTNTKYTNLEITEQWTSSCQRLLCNFLLLKAKVFFQESLNFGA